MKKELKILLTVNWSLDRKDAKIYVCGNAEKKNCESAHVQNH